MSLKSIMSSHRKIFQVHESILYQYKFFKYHELSGLGSFPVHSLTTSALEMFVHWLYNKKLAHVSQADEEEAKIQVRHLVSLYLKSWLWNIRSLRNDIVDKIRRRQTCHMGWFPHDLINDLYAGAPETCQLRKMVIDLFVFKSRNWNKDYQHLVLETQLDAGNYDFVIDIVTRKQ